MFRSFPVTLFLALPTSPLWLMLGHYVLMLFSAFPSIPIRCSSSRFITAEHIPSLFYLSAELGDATDFIFVSFLPEMTNTCE